MFFGERITSCSTPSTRNRIRTSVSVGSMWMSEARSSTALVSTMCTSLTMGASSTAASAASMETSSCCSIASAVRASTEPSSCPYLRMAAMMSAAVATTGWMSRAVIVRMSSSA